MQGRRLEVLVGQLADDVRKALALRERESETLARLESVECAARAGYVTDRPEAPIGHVMLGAILDDEDHRFFVVPAALIGQGVLISGANCTEMSHSLEYILGTLAESRIPWLVIEPKEPYEILTDLHHLPSLYVIGNYLDSAAVKFNPLELEAGFPLPVHLDMVRALFMAALGSARASFPYSLSAVLQGAYTRYGWNVLTGKTSQADPIFPELVNLKYANRYSRDSDEYEEIPAADEADLNALVQLLLSGQACSWLDLGYRVNMRKLLNAYVAVRIADVAPEAKGFLVGTLMLRIFERAKMAAREDASRRLRHVTVIKDASILLSDPVPPPRSASACRTLADALAEMRHYGESIILYEQSPAELMPTVMHKTGLKIIHRLSTRDDRNAISAVVNADERTSSRLMTLGPGVAMVIAEGMDRPIEVQLGPSVNFAKPSCPET
jgi:hypothetical protein